MGGAGLVIAGRHRRPQVFGRLGAGLLVMALATGACGDDADLDAGADPGDPTTTTTTTTTTGQAPRAELTFTVRLLGPGGDPSTYALTCTGATGALAGDPAPAAADAMCLALENPAVGRRLVVGPPADQMCTEIYGGPETAEVTGTLDGASVDAEFHRTNGCGIADWDLFATLLPEPG